MTTPRRLQTLSGHLPEIVLVFASALFLAMGLFYTDRIPAWHEEVSVYPSTGYRILEPNGLETQALPLAPWCGDSHPPAVILSPSRPVFSACFRGLTLPVMVTPYFTGIIYWPSALLSWWHHGDVFLLRKLSLLVGLASLLQTYRLAVRLADRTTAAVGALLTSVTPAFVFAHSLLLLYEAIPWLFVSTALLVFPQELVRQASGRVRPEGENGPESGRASSRQLSTARLAGAVTLLGLSVLANIKAVFLIVPIAAVAWRAGIAWRRIRLRQWAAMLLAGAFPLLPVAVFAAIDPRSGLQGQMQGRLSILLRHLDPRRFAQEVHNFIIHASDMGVFGDLATGALPRYSYPGWILPAIALVWGMISLVQLARRRRASPLAAGSGALFFMFLLVSALLYDQYPAANYEPLHAVFGFAAAAGAMRLGETTGRLLRARAVPAGIAIAIAGAAPIAHNCYRTGALAADMPLPINTIAERDLAQYLIDHPHPGPSLWTTTYNYAGLLDSLGHGKLAPVQAHELLLGSDTRLGGAGAEDEIAARWRRILGDSRRLPLRVVVPAVTSRIEEPGAASLVPALHRAAAALNLTVELERTFHTRAGLAVIALYTVLPPSQDRAPALAPP